MDALTILNNLINRQIAGEFDSLNLHERKAALLNTLLFEVHNGGWTQFLYNSVGDHIEEYKRYIVEFDYQGIASAIKLIEEKFGCPIPTDRMRRVSLLINLREEIDDEVGKSFNNEVNELFDKDIDSIWDDLETYIEKHAEHFASGSANHDERQEVEGTG